MKMIYLKWGHSIKTLSYFASITLNYAEPKSLTNKLSFESTTVKEVCY